MSKRSTSELRPVPSLRNTMIQIMKMKQFNEPPSYLHNARLMHGDAVLWRLRQLEKRPSRGPVDVLVTRPQVLDERGHGVLLAERLPVRAPVAAASNRFSQMLSQLVVNLEEKTIIGQSSGTDHDLCTHEQSLQPGVVAACRQPAGKKIIGQSSGTDCDLYPSALRSMVGSLYHYGWFDIW